MLGSGTKKNATQQRTVHFSTFYIYKYNAKTENNQKIKNIFCYVSILNYI